MYRSRKQQLFLLCSTSASPLRSNWWTFRNVDHLFNIEAGFLRLWRCRTLRSSEIRGTGWPGSKGKTLSKKHGGENDWDWLKSGWRQGQWGHEGCGVRRRWRRFSGAVSQTQSAGWHQTQHTHTHRALFIIGFGWLLVHIWNWLHNFTLIINQTATASHLLSK